MGRRAIKHGCDLKFGKSLKGLLTVYFKTYKKHEYLNVRAIQNNQKAIYTSTECPSWFGIEAVSIVLCHGSGCNDRAQTAIAGGDHKPEVLVKYRWTRRWLGTACGFLDVSMHEGLGIKILVRLYITNVILGGR